MAEGVAEKFVGIDFTDGETVFDRCAEAIQKVCWTALDHSNLVAMALPCANCCDGLYTAAASFYGLYTAAASFYGLYAASLH